MASSKNGEISTLGVLTIFIEATISEEISISLRQDVIQIYSQNQNDLLTLTKFGPSPLYRP
jgi:hypothetical protein